MLFAVRVTLAVVSQGSMANGLYVDRGFLVSAPFLSILSSMGARASRRANAVRVVCRYLISCFS